MDVLFRNWWPERRRRGEILIPSCSEASGKGPAPPTAARALKFSAPLATSALILEELRVSLYVESPGIEQYGEWGEALEQVCSN